MFRLIIIALILIPLTHFSQGNNKLGIKGEIFGVVLESGTSQPMEYVSIALYNKKDSVIVSGGISNNKGRFNITEIPAGNYFLTISFVGYQSKTIENVNISKVKTVYDFKTVILENSLQLKEVIINGDIPKVTYEIDKKIVNVEDMNITAGQSAVEVLQNTPSIQVDNEGNIQLRGSGSFTLLINGVPTAMDASDALQAIPASTIKNIEIVTNPSAREQAEGVGGIINIITKKNKLEGISMLVNVSGGNFERYGGNLAINYREKKHAFNLNASYNQRNRPKATIEERISDYETYETRVLQVGESSWKHGGLNVGGEWIYSPNSAHVLSVGSRIGKRSMNPYNNSKYEEFYNDSLVNSFENKFSNEITINSLSNFVSYRYNIKRDKSRYINFKAIYNMKSVDEYTFNDFYDENNTKIGGNYGTEFGPSNVLRFDLDYLMTFKKKIVLESGIQSQFGLSKDDRDSYEYNTITEKNDRVDLYSTDVQYNRNIHSAYSLLKGKTNKLGYQIGLRAEYTQRKIEATNLSNPFQEINRIDFFPSAHFSYKLKKNQQLLFSYSRRINRPRSYYFEPFITWESPYSVRKGNAELSPEYINSIEANYIKELGTKGSFSLEAYAKLLNNMIKRVPSVYDTNVVINLPENAGNSTSIGIDPTFIYYVKSWWNTNLGVSLYYYTVNTSLDVIERKSESFNYNINWINSFTFLDNYKLQLVSKYRSRSASALGFVEDNYSLDASIRKSIMKNKLSFIFAVNDVLSTKRRVYQSSINNLTVYNNNNPASPMFMLTVSLKLNNYSKTMKKQQELDDF
ncbi:TonB-dependent receptor [Flavobacteriales bacterium]|nr:TonB-dependent receptor [Flavobacteriales bacterium]